MANNQASVASDDSESQQSGRMMLFWSCFMAIAATAAVFVIRAQVIGEWGEEFGLNETQKGEILGVGLWPFAGAIVLASLVVDRIGYGKTMAFAFVCHVLSTVLLIFAQGYWWLYIGTFIVSIGNGAAQAVADPVVASMFRKNKTTWLNILHASWPGGMVVAGVFGIAVGAGANLDWRWRVATLLIPMAVYGLLMLGQKFPVHERVEAGVSDYEMFRETGAIGLFLVLVFLFGEIGRWAGVEWYVPLICSIVCCGAFGIYVKSFGQPIFLFLLLLMIPLATTELGTDSWITDLMKGPMEDLSINAGWVLVYTSLIMMILRFCAAPVVKVFSPIGLLIVSCVLAAAGLVMLSRATGLAILGAATLYGFGKTYLWPTMLGIVAERFPKGGALSLNAASAVGMMSVGIVGTVFLGQIQDRAVEDRLKSEQQELHQQLVTEKTSVLGKYQAVDPILLKDLGEDDKKTVDELTQKASKSALSTIAIFPIMMLVGYIALLIVFRIQGGYKAIDLHEV